MCALSLPVTENDATPSEVVGSYFHLHAIARKDPDPMHSHLPGTVGKHLMPVLKLYLEYGIR